MYKTHKGPYKGRKLSFNLSVFHLNEELSKLVSFNSSMRTKLKYECIGQIALVIILRLTFTFSSAFVTSRLFLRSGFCCFPLLFLCCRVMSTPLGSGSTCCQVFDKSYYIFPAAYLLRTIIFARHILFCIF